MPSWIDKLSYKLRRIAIPGLMKYIVVTMGAVFILDLVFNYAVSDLLMFSLNAIMAGEVWRIISFIFLPFNSSPIFLIFTLYFYWMIGEALEREWGEARFNIFYLTGIIGTIVAGLITGYATNYYLNMSLFFAFAILYPNFEILLFFILPVKVKWLAWLNAAYFAYMLIVVSWPAKIALLVSLANIALFFYKDFSRRVHSLNRQRKWKNHFK